jgi:hypothetical protein
MPEFLVIRKRKFEALKNLYNEKQIELAPFQKSVQFIIDEIQKKINEYGRTEMKLREYLSKLRSGESKNKPTVPMRPKQRAEIEIFLTELLTEIEQEPQLEDKKELEDFLTELLNELQAKINEPIHELKAQPAIMKVKAIPTDYKKAREDYIAELDSILKQKIDNIKLTNEDTKNYEKDDLTPKFLKMILKTKKKMVTRALIKTEKKDRINNEKKFLKQINESLKSDKSGKKLINSNIPKFYIKYHNQILEEKKNVKINKQRKKDEEEEAFFKTPEGIKALIETAKMEEDKKQTELRRQRALLEEEEEFNKSMLNSQYDTESLKSGNGNQQAERQKFLDMLELLNNLPEEVHEEEIREPYVQEGIPYDYDLM